jgi:hypothetical protein
MSSGAAADGARGLLVAAWDRGSLELWRVDGRPRGAPERQPVKTPPASESDRATVRIRMTSGGAGWLRTRLEARSVFARLTDQGRRVEPCPAAPGEGEVDVNAGRIHARDVVTLVEVRRAARSGEPTGSRVHTFDGTRWQSWESPPSLVVNDVSFASAGGVWLACGPTLEAATLHALFLLDSPSSEPERVPVRLDPATRLRFAAGGFLGAETFEQLHRVHAESPALLAVGDSPDLFEDPASYVLARRPDGLFSGHRFAFPVQVVPTPSCAIVVGLRGSVSTVDADGRLRRRASDAALARLMASRFPDAASQVTVVRADALDDGGLAVLAQIGDGAEPSAQAICVSRDLGFEWEALVATRPDLGEPRLADATWLR